MKPVKPSPKPGPPVRGSDTACAVAENPQEIKSRLAELLVLRGMLHCGVETAAELAAIPLAKGDFYYERHQRLFDATTYLATGGESSGPYEVTLHLRARRETLDFPDAQSEAYWLAEVYCLDYWIPELLRDWTNPLGSCRGLSNSAWSAGCAARLVRHLSCRRQAYHVAQEVIRDCLNPTHDAAGYLARLDRLEEL